MQQKPGLQLGRGPGVPRLLRELSGATGTVLCPQDRTGVTRETWTTTSHVPVCWGHVCVWEWNGELCRALSTPSSPLQVLWSHRGPMEGEEGAVLRLQAPCFCFEGAG